MQEIQRPNGGGSDREILAAAPGLPSSLQQFGYNRTNDGGAVVFGVRSTSFDVSTRFDAYLFCRYLFAAPGRDSKGRRVIIARPGKLQFVDNDSSRSPSFKFRNVS